MNEKQLKKAIELGNDIARGKIDIVPLDNRSLGLRGTKQKASSLSEDKKNEDACSRELGTESQKHRADGSTC
jgi:hypothetical protein